MSRVSKDLKVIKFTYPNKDKIVKLLLSNASMYHQYTEDGDHMEVRLTLSTAKKLAKEFNKLTQPKRRIKK